MNVPYFSINLKSVKRRFNLWTKFDIRLFHGVVHILMQKKQQKKTSNIALQLMVSALIHIEHRELYFFLVV